MWRETSWWSLRWSVTRRPVTRRRPSWWAWPRRTSCSCSSASHTTPYPSSATGAPASRSASCLGSPRCSPPRPVSSTSQPSASRGEYHYYLSFVYMEHQFLCALIALIALQWKCENLLGEKQPNFTEMSTSLEMKNSNADKRLRPILCQRQRH